HFTDHRYERKAVSGSRVSRFSLASAKGWHPNRDCVLVAISYSRTGAVTSTDIARTVMPTIKRSATSDAARPIPEARRRAHAATTAPTTEGPTPVMVTTAR